MSNDPDRIDGEFDPERNITAEDIVSGVVLPDGCIVVSAVLIVQVIDPRYGDMPVLRRWLSEENSIFEHIGTVGIIHDELRLAVQGKEPGTNFAQEDPP